MRSGANRMPERTESGPKRAADSRPLVVKVGGGNDTNLQATALELAALHAAGRRIVLIHGGNSELDRLSTALGNPPRFVTSPSGQVSRYTDERTLDAFMMTYPGKINTRLVEALQAAGANALGLSGVDGRLVVGTFKGSVRSAENGRVIILRGDNTGTVEKVNAELLELLLGSGYLPVLSPPAISHCNRAMNVDGDRMAAAVAAALGANELLLLSNVPGLLRDPSNEASLVSRVTLEEESAALSLAQGRMKAKVASATMAVRSGVTRAVIGDARGNRPVTDALNGNGTVFSC